MATLREYFDTDFTRMLNAAEPLTVEGGTTRLEVFPRVHLDFDSNTKFVSCFIPDTPDPLSVVVALLKSLDRVLAIADGVEVQTALPGENKMHSRDLRFSGRFFVYTERAIPEETLAELSDQARKNGIYLQFRGPAFAQSRSALEKPVAFISHDSRDKDAVARPIAMGLTRLMCPVWFDEFSLKVGDRLRETIERGLRECKKCVLVLSPHFLSNPGWSKVEFNSIFTRELVDQTDLILPVWHNVDRKDVFEYSPTLADRLAARWGDGEEQVVRCLHRAIDQPS
jgi:hypothetical protein